MESKEKQKFNPDTGCQVVNWCSSGGPNSGMIRKRGEISAKLDAMTISHLTRQTVTI
jgi:hypothetical protein